MIETFLPSLGSPDVHKGESTWIFLTRNLLRLSVRSCQQVEHWQHPHLICKFSKTPRLHQLMKRQTKHARMAMKTLLLFSTWQGRKLVGKLTRKKDTASGEVLSLSLHLSVQQLPWTDSCTVLPASVCQTVTTHFCFWLKHWLQLYYRLIFLPPSNEDMALESTSGKIHKYKGSHIHLFNIIWTNLCPILFCFQYFCIFFSWSSSLYN